ncbi:ABC transporter substrate-binding protein [Devosia sp. 2618]|uniref:ABC transporter substrate-binding protein n=1 Tax=Devosia sp. 2618 TaxID=3156454 RepID=UPI003396066A
MSIISRRQFILGAAGLGATLLAGPTLAQSSVRTITTSVGTYDIPADPKRVVVIDTRLDLEPAVALGLPIVGYSYYQDIEPWVPYEGADKYIGTPPSREAVLALDPDLIVCTDIPESELWPIDKLSDIAPVLPVDFNMHWRDNLTRMGDWLGRRDRADAFIAAYEAEVEAFKIKHAAVLNRKVAAIWSSPDAGEINILMGVNTPQVTAIGQVLDDLGGITVSPEGLGEYGNVSYERMDEILADVEGIVIDHFEQSELDALETSPVWSRLPAVKAGRALPTSGAYYGGGYTARHLIGEWDKLYSLLSA